MSGDKLSTRKPQQTRRRDQQRRLGVLPSWARLGWPAGNNGVVTADNDNIGKPESRSSSLSTLSFFTPNKNKKTMNDSTPVSKRRRKNTAATAITTNATTTTMLRTCNSNGENNNNELWINKYEPQTVKELCVAVAPKKVREVESWIKNSNSIFSGAGACAGSNINYNSKLLVLVGSAGIGKSTMIRVLAKELHMEIKEWNDSYYDSSMRHSMASSSNYMTVDQYSPLQLFEIFLKQTSVGYQSLNILPTTTMTKHTANTTKPKAKPIQQQLLGRKRKSSSTSTTRTSSCSSCSINVSQQMNGGSLILLDDLPNLYSPEAAIRFRQIMKEHLSNSQVPTVLIFSDTQEGKHKPEDLERLVDATYLYSPLVQIMQMQPVTKVRQKKVLEAVSRKERLTGVSPLLYDRLYSQCGGDIRNALMTLQFDSVVMTKEKKKQKQRRPSSNHYVGTNDDDENKSIQQVYQRDVQLSTFHALGKILYAKRQQASTASTMSLFRKGANRVEQPRPPLDFDPDHTLQNCEMELGGSLTFLQSHSIDFFTDITELSDALGRFSDAALLADQPIDQRRDLSCFPDGYVSSLAGRAVANANKHPATNRFRQLSAPKIFEVIRNRRENKVEFRHLHRRLLFAGSDELSLGNSTVCVTDSFVTDCLPYLRTIEPLHVNASLGRMHSYFLPRNNENFGGDNDTTFAQAMKEQEEILEIDDIVEDDDSDSEDENENDNKRYGAPLLQDDAHATKTDLRPSESNNVTNTRNSEFNKTPSNSLRSSSLKVVVKDQPEVIILDSD